MYVTIRQMCVVHLQQTIKIGDFGMSRFVGADSVATATGRRTLNRNLTIDIIGTAHYASPEMLNDELLVRHSIT